MDLICKGKSEQTRGEISAAMNRQDELLDGLSKLLLTLEELMSSILRQEKTSDSDNEQKEVYAGSMLSNAINKNNVSIMKANEKISNLMGLLDI